MTDDLFGAMPPGQPTTPGRGPEGGKHYTLPKGYAGRPGTGPAGKRCKDCDNYVRCPGGARSYPKCSLTQPNWTRGRGSDILARSPACSYFKGIDDAPSAREGS